MVNSSDSVSAVVAGKTFATPVEARDDHAPGSNSGDTIPFPPDGSRYSKLSVESDQLHAVCDQCQQQGISILGMDWNKGEPMYTLKLLFPERQRDLEWEQRTIYEANNGAD